MGRMVGMRIIIMIVVTGVPVRYARLRTMGDNLVTDALTPAHLAPVALKLIVVSGPDFKKEIILEGGTYRVGKDPACELVLSDGAVSRTHLVLEMVAQGVRVTDPGSTNGSFFDGARFQSITV